MDIISNMSYTNKDFESIYKELLNVTKKISHKWDPTQSNESDPGVVLIKLCAIIADKLNYSIDKNILETFPVSVTQEKNARNLFEQLGYYMHWYKSATTDIQLRWKSADKAGVVYTLPKNTMVCDADSEIVYTTVDECQLSDDGSFVSCPVMQGILQEFRINGEQIISTANLDSHNRIYFDSYGIAENGIFISCNLYSDKEWRKVDNLEVEGYGQPVYKFGCSDDGYTCYIEFPEDAHRLFGDGLTIKYLATDGYEGNIGSRVLTDFYNEAYVTFFNPTTGSKDRRNVTTEDIIIKNDKPAINGYDRETIDEAFKGYQKTVGTFDTLITLRDYNNAIKTAKLDNINIVSNGFVCDRTNDLQYSYNIVSDVDDLEKIVNCIEIEDDNSPKMTAFDLKLYLLQNVATTENIISMDKDKKIWEKTYNTTFTPIDNNEDVVSYQIDVLKQYLSEKKSLQHDFQPLFSDRLCLIKNKYPIRCKIIPQYELNKVQAEEIRNNVIRALYNNLNSRAVEFGKEIDYEKLSDIIKTSDARIKFVMLDSYDYETYAVYYNPKGNSLEERYKEICINNVQEGLIPGYYSNGIFYSKKSKSVNGSSVFKTEDIIEAKQGDILYDIETGKVYSREINVISEIVDEDRFTEDMRLKLLTQVDIISKSVLSGKTQILDPDNEFEHKMNQVHKGTYSDIDRLSTEADIRVYGNGRASYTLHDNEAIRLYTPNLIDSTTYSGFIKVQWALKQDVPKDSSYILTPGESITFYWTETDSDSALYKYYQYKPNKNGLQKNKFGEYSSVIIKPNFSMLMSNSYYVDGAISRSNSENEVEYVGKDFKPGEGYCTEDQSRYISDIYNNDYILSSNKTISIQDENMVVMENPERYYFILNKKIHSHNGDYDICQLFPEIKASSEKTVQTYVLQENETFFHIYKDSGSVEMVGQGTRLQRIVDPEINAPPVQCVSLNTDDMNVEGLDILNKYTKEVGSTETFVITEMKIIEFPPESTIFISGYSWEEDNTAVENEGTVISGKGETPSTKKLPITATSKAYNSSYDSQWVWEEDVDDEGNPKYVENVHESTYEDNINIELVAKTLAVDPESKKPSDVSVNPKPKGKFIDKTYKNTAGSKKSTKNITSLSETDKHPLHAYNPSYSYNEEWFNDSANDYPIDEKGSYTPPKTFESKDAVKIEWLEDPEYLALGYNLSGNIGSSFGLTPESTKDYGTTMVNVSDSYGTENDKVFYIGDKVLFNCKDNADLSGYKVITSERASIFSMYTVSPNNGITNTFNNFKNDEILAKTINSEYICVVFGYNDALLDASNTEKFKEYYIDLIVSLFKKNSKARITLCTAPSTKNIPQTAVGFESINSKIYECFSYLKELKYNVRFFDLHEAMRGTDDLFSTNSILKLSEYLTGKIRLDTIVDPLFNLPIGTYHAYNPKFELNANSNNGMVWIMNTPEESDIDENGNIYSKPNLVEIGGTMATPDDCRIIAHENDACYEISDDGTYKVWESKIVDRKENWKTFNEAHGEPITVANYSYGEEPDTTLDYWYNTKNLMWYKKDAYDIWVNAADAFSNNKVYPTIKKSNVYIGSASSLSNCVSESLQKMYDLGYFSVDSKGNYIGPSYIMCNAPSSEPDPVEGNYRQLNVYQITQLKSLNITNPMVNIEANLSVERLNLRGGIADFTTMVIGKENSFISADKASINTAVASEDLFCWSDTLHDSGYLLINSRYLKSITVVHTPETDTDTPSTNDVNIDETVWGPVPGARYGKFNKNALTDPPNEPDVYYYASTNGDIMAKVPSEVVFKWSSTPIQISNRELFVINYINSNKICHQIIFKRQDNKTNDIYASIVCKDGLKSINTSYSLDTEGVSVSKYFSCRYDYIGKSWTQVVNFDNSVKRIIDDTGTATPTSENILATYGSHCYLKYDGYVWLEDYIYVDDNTSLTVTGGVGATPVTDALTPEASMKARNPKYGFEYLWQEDPEYTDYENAFDYLTGDRETPESSKLSPSNVGQHVVNPNYIREHVWMQLNDRPSDAIIYGDTTNTVVFQTGTAPNYNIRELLRRGIKYAYKYNADLEKASSEDTNNEANIMNNVWWQIVPEKGKSWTSVVSYAGFGKSWTAYPVEVCKTWTLGRRYQGKSWTSKYGNVTKRWTAVPSVIDVKFNNNIVDGVSVISPANHVLSQLYIEQKLKDSPEVVPLPNILLPDGYIGQSVLGMKVSSNIPEKLYENQRVICKSNDTQNIINGWYTWKDSDEVDGGYDLISTDEKNVYRIPAQTGLHIYYNRPDASVVSYSPKPVYGWFEVDSHVDIQEWSPLKTYSVNDIVKFGNGYDSTLEDVVYKCISDVVNPSNILPINDETHWMALFVYDNHMSYEVAVQNGIEYKANLVELSAIYSSLPEFSADEKFFKPAYRDGEVVSFDLLTVKPDDWEINWSNYYGLHVDLKTYDIADINKYCYYVRKVKHLEAQTDYAPNHYFERVVEKRGNVLNTYYSVSYRLLTSNTEPVDWNLDKTKYFDSDAIENKFNNIFWVSYVKSMRWENDDIPTATGFEVMSEPRFETDSQGHIVDNSIIIAEIYPQQNLNVNEISDSSVMPKKVIYTPCYLLSNAPMDLVGGKDIDVVRINADGEKLPLDIYTYRLASYDNKNIYYDDADNVLKVIFDKKPYEEGAEIKPYSVIYNIEFNFPGSEEADKPNGEYVFKISNNVENCTKITYFVTNKKLSLNSYNISIANGTVLSYMADTSYKTMEKNRVYYLSFNTNTVSRDEVGKYYLVIKADFDAPVYSEAEKNNAASLKTNGQLLIYPAFKYNKNKVLVKNGLYNMVLERMNHLDRNKNFDWVYEVNSDVLIKDPLMPESFFDRNHIYNPFVICQIKTDATTGKNDSKNLDVQITNIQK